LAFTAGMIATSGAAASDSREREYELVAAVATGDRIRR
jgi:hypothetical protein